MTRSAIVALVCWVVAALGCGSGRQVVATGGAPGSSGAGGRGGAGGAAGVAGGAEDAASPDGPGGESDGGDAPADEADGSASDAALDVTDAHAGVCPPSTSVNMCENCPGVSCASGDGCRSTYHRTGWFTTACTCFEGHLGCCEWSDLYGITFCNYAGFPQPPCPRPASGDPCDSTVSGCRFSDPCCAGGSNPGGSAWCQDGSWRVICRQPLHGEDCSTVPSGTRCDLASTGDGASSACRCDDRDAGGKIWTCGSGI